MHCNQPTSYRGLDYYESMNDQIRRLIESMTSNKRHVPITPWSSQQEWNFVAETLWSRQINHIRMGIRVCETWMIRSLSIPIPPAVESTLAIFKIVLLCNDSVIHKFFEINRSSAHDHKSHLSTGPLSETYTDDDNDAISGYEEMINEKNSCKYCNESKNFVVDEGTIRLALSAAIIRFVNESVDPLQQGMFAVPITGLADRLGIPRSVVDIRHEATHDVLPSLESLLNASRLVS